MPVPVAILICRNCGASFEAQAFNAKYCTLRCQDAAYRKRRRLRNLGVLPKAPAHYDLPAPVDMGEVDRLAREIEARNAGKEVTAEIAPTSSQQGVEDFMKSIGASVPRPKLPGQGENE